MKILGSLSVDVDPSKWAKFLKTARSNVVVDIANMLQEKCKLVQKK